MTRIRKTPVSKIPLTHDTVVDVAGNLGDAMIARILAVGATV